MSATGEKASPTTLSSRRRFVCVAEPPRPPVLERDVLLGSAAFSARRSAAVAASAAPPLLSGSMSCANLSRICATNTIATPTAEMAQILPSSSTSTSFMSGSCSANAIDQLQSVEATKILEFLFLGSQNDALNAELLKRHGITRVINLSETCPPPSALPDDAHHFLRIPIKDSYCAKLLPHFDDAFKFIEAARATGDKVLVHCLAGISRSPTLTIAYVMRSKQMVSDEAYKFVKSLRPSISPNFNFLGQLMEYEKLLRDQKVLPQQQQLPSPHSTSTMNQRDANAKLVGSEKQQTNANATISATVDKAPPSSLTVGERPLPSPSTVCTPTTVPVTTMAVMTRPRQLISSACPPFSRFSCPSMLFPFGAAQQLAHAGESVPSPSTEFSRLDISLANPCFGLPTTPGAPSRQLQQPNPAVQRQAVQTNKLERESVPLSVEKIGGEVQAVLVGAAPVGEQPPLPPLPSTSPQQPQTCENPMFSLMMNNGGAGGGGGKRRWQTMGEKDGTRKANEQQQHEQQQWHRHHHHDMTMKRMAAPPPLARFSARNCLPMPSEEGDESSLSTTDELFKMGTGDDQNDAIFGGGGGGMSKGRRIIMSNAQDDDFDGFGRHDGRRGEEKRPKKLVVEEEEDNDGGTFAGHHGDDDDDTFGTRHYSSPPMGVVENGNAHHHNRRQLQQQQQLSATKKSDAGGGRQLLSHFRHHFQPNKFLLPTFAHGTSAANLSNNNNNNSCSASIQQQTRRHHNRRLAHPKGTTPTDHQHQQQKKQEQGEASAVAAVPTSSNAQQSSAFVPKRKQHQHHPHHQDNPHSYHHSWQVHRLLMASLGGMRRRTRDVGGAIFGGSPATAHGPSGNSRPDVVGVGSVGRRRRMGTVSQHFRQSLPTVPDMDNDEDGGACCPSVVVDSHGGGADEQKVADDAHATAAGLAFRSISTLAHSEAEQSLASSSSGTVVHQPTETDDRASASSASSLEIVAVQ